MPLICKLPDHVANQIAAGEVVERPVAVIKELVENAIDSGASKIDIEYRQAGKSLMRVSDNGCGMDREDAQLCLQRHATSKIRDVGDILAIHSFGFRGEALPSIASVSRFTLRTRRAEDPVGTEVLVQGGQVARVADCGMPPGTVVEVAQLFATVPARRKFLKTDKTEAAHIIQYARLAAIAHPNVAFTLVEDGRTVWQSPVCSSVKERIGEIFGRALVPQLLPLKATDSGGMQLNGYIGKPNFGRPTRSEMLCFVNLRPVESRLLTHALIESYHSYLPRNRYPLAFLYLSIPTHLVDVNVHPAKKEIRFQDDPAVRRFVMESILSVLREASKQPPLRVTPVPPAAPLPPAMLQPAIKPPARPGVERVPELAKAQVPDVPPDTARPPEPQRVEPPQASPPREARVDWKLLGVLRGRIAVFESTVGLVHLFIPAARERVLFESIYQTFGDRSQYSQSLLFPIPMEFDPISATLMEEHGSFFADLGFTIEPFGRTVFRLTAVPTWFSPEDGESFVRELLGKIRERGLRPDKTDQAREQVAKLAAARAARQPFKMEPGSLQQLVRRLFSANQPLQDPRGRPTFTETPFNELEKPFS